MFATIDRFSALVLFDPLLGKWGSRWKRKGHWRVLVGRVGTYVCREFDPEAPIDHVAAGGACVCIKGRSLSKATIVEPGLQRLRANR